MDRIVEDRLAVRPERRELLRAAEPRAHAGGETEQGQGHEEVLIDSVDTEKSENF